MLLSQANPLVSLPAWQAEIDESSTLQYYYRVEGKLMLLSPPCAVVACLGKNACSRSRSGGVISSLLAMAHAVGRLFRTWSWTRRAVRQKIWACLDRLRTRYRTGAMVKRPTASSGPCRRTHSCPYVGTYHCSDPYVVLFFHVVVTVEIGSSSARVRIPNCFRSRDKLPGQRLASQLRFFPRPRPTSCVSKSKQGVGERRPL